MKYDILHPVFYGNEKKYLNECIDTTWISSNGKFINLFENKFKDTFISNNNHVLSTSNGTCAIELVLRAFDIGVGDEVIVPNLTFGATVNAVKLVGAIPIFVDVDDKTWNLDVNEVDRVISKKTKAIIAVDLYGLPCLVESISQLCKNNNLYFIQDSAESLGSSVNDIYIGNFADATTFSFFANKIITSGEGGMCVFKSRLFYEKASIIKNHGMSKNIKYKHELVGGNYRLTNMQAAIGLAQLENFDKILTDKINIGKYYRDFIDNSLFQKENKNVKNNYWLNTIRFNSERKRLVVQNELMKNGIETRRVFSPMNSQPAFKFDKSFLISEDIFKCGLCLPSSADLKMKDVKYISNIINGLL